MRFSKRSIIFRPNRWFAHPNDHQPMAPAEAIQGIARSASIPPSDSSPLNPLAETPLEFESSIKIHHAQARAPNVKVIPACDQALQPKDRSPRARSAAGNSATRTTASPLRFGVKKPHVAPTITSRYDCPMEDLFRSKSACHFKASMPQLTGTSKAANATSDQRSGDSWPQSSDCIERA